MPKNSSNLLYLETISIGVLFVALIVFIAYFNFNGEIGNASVSTDSKNTSQIVKAIQSPNINLKIPKIGVDAQVEYVGLTSEGSMDAPEGPDNVGLFSMGVSPGEVGSAVMDGHSGWKDGKQAVFDNLDKLEKGDQIFVENDKKEIFTFSVQEIRTYDPDADVPQVFDSSDGGSHLNLITCTGAWNEATKSHSKRLVVFTTIKQ